MPRPDRLTDVTLPGAFAPPYDRSAPPGIVHVGVGAFARAHLACYADELLRAGWPAMIRGVSLRSRRAEEQLAPQDGLFAVLERGEDQPPSVTVVGSLASVETGPAAAVDAIADPATTMVTTTVTERGYELEPGDLEVGRVPASAPAVIARGLLARPGDAPPPVIAALDNLLDNGRVLRARVREVVAGVEPERVDWFDRSIAFPSSVVDRIVPATTPADLDEVADRLGVVDLAAVVAEPHRSWVIERVPGLPPLAGVGVAVVDEIEPWQRRKLWLLNGPHSAVAYAGLLARVATVAEAVRDASVAQFAGGYVRDVLEVADLPPQLDPAGFADEALRRFRNPALQHRCQQVGADGSRKLAQRLRPVAERRLDRGLPIERTAAVVALWAIAAAGLPVAGQPLAPVDDPAAPALLRLGASGVVPELCEAALGLALGSRLAAPVADAVRTITSDGVAALERWA